jgi:hypothetical protein
MLTTVPSPPTLGFTIPGRLADSRKFNEAEMGSLTLRLAFSLPQCFAPDQVTPSRDRTATCQTDNYMASTSQLTRLTRLRLAHQDNRICRISLSEHAKAGSFASHA